MFDLQLDNYIIVDIGANLTSKKFARDLDSVIKRAKDSGMYFNECVFVHSNMGMMKGCRFNATFPAESE